MLLKKLKTNPSMELIDFFYSLVLIAAMAFFGSIFFTVLEKTFLKRSNNKNKN